MNAFNLLGKRIEFSDETMNFAKCYGHYRDMQKGADQLLCSIYDAYGTFTNLVNQAETDCLRIIYGFADTFVNKVIDAGFYDLSTERFLEEYVARMTRRLETVSVCDAIVDKYVEIEQEKEEVKRYRELRKEARGRMIGGGFGLDGAVAGMAMAGTLNAISGLGHSAVNAIGNMGTDAEAQQKGRKIYENAQTRQRLREALETDLFVIFKGYLYLLEDKLDLHTRFKEMIRLSGRAYPVAENEQEEWIDRIFEEQPYLANVYPGDTRKIGIVFAIKSGTAEYFNLGVHPIFRESYSMGGASIPAKGYQISERCIGCGTCRKHCPQGCIKEGKPFVIEQEHCLHCGNCMEHCPVHAVEAREK